MTYIALFRGINVGGNNKVDMKKLKSILEDIDYTNVSTYLNSGNAIFDSSKTLEEIYKDFSEVILNEFGLDVPILIKSKDEIKKIASTIPEKWQNNKEEKTDVAYLFPEIDSQDILDKLPIKKEFIELIYVNGAVIWHVMRTDYNKSQLNKIVGQKLYKLMTVRNVNTARFLARD